MLTDMYERITPSTLPKVGDRKVVATGPGSTAEGVVTAVDPEGVIILKLLTGVLLVGYWARSTAPPGVHRITRDGHTVKTPDEMWIFNTVERR